MNNNEMNKIPVEENSEKVNGINNENNNNETNNNNNNNNNNGVEFANEVEFIEGDIVAKDYDLTNTMDQRKPKKFYAIKFLLDLYKIKNMIKYASEEERKQVFKDYLAQFEFCPCQYNYKSIIKSDAKLKFLLKGKKKKHKYILVRNKIDKSRFNFGLMGEGDLMSANAVIYFLDYFYKNTIKCGNGRLRFFKLTDENQHPIGTDLESLSRDECNRKGYLLAFLWKNIDYIIMYKRSSDLEIEKQRLIKNTNKTINNFNNEPYDNIPRTFVISRELTERPEHMRRKYIITDYLEPRLDTTEQETYYFMRTKYIALLPEIKYRLFDRGYSTYKNTKKLNCRTFVHKMLGYKTFKKLHKYKLPKKKTKTKKRSKSQFKRTII